VKQIQLRVEHHGKEMTVRVAASDEEAGRWLTHRGPDLYFCKTVNTPDNEQPESANELT